MFLYLALAAELCILEAYRDSKRRLPLFIIPCIAAVLNNIHPSALILGIVLFFYGIDFTYQAALAGRNPLDEAWLFGALGVAALLFSAMNPYGFRQTLLPLALAAQTEYLRDIVEFYPAMQTDMKWLFLAILFLGMVSMLIGKRSNLSDWLMLFFFGYLGMRHVRNVALLAFAAFIPVSCGADRLYELIRERFRNQMRSITSGAALIGIALVSTATIRSGAWGAGVQPGIFPEETAVVMQQLRPQGRLFNHYATGGYLAWQLFDAGYPVFIDGRHFGLDRSYEEYLKVYSALPGWQDIIQRYAITSIALPPVEAYTGAYVPILIPICDDPAWLLAGMEDSGMLFLKKGSVRGLEEGLPKRLVWEEVIREAHGVLEAKPNSAQAVLSIGIAYYKMKDFDRSAAYLREYLRKLPSTDSDAAAVKKILGEMPREQR
jgi:tetratricopeptide (TPR) repeat protein